MKIGAEDLRKMLRDDLELRSKAEAGAVIEDIDAVVEAVVSRLNEGDSAKIGKYLVIKKVTKKGTSGVMSRLTPSGEVEKIPFSKEDEVVVKVSVTDACNDLVEK